MEIKTLKQLKGTLGESPGGYSFGLDPELRRKYKTVEKAILAGVKHLDAKHEWPDEFLPIWTMRPVKVDEVSPSGFWFLGEVRDTIAALHFDNFLGDVSEKQMESLGDLLTRGFRYWIKQERIYFNYSVGVDCVSVRHRYLREMAGGIKNERGKTGKDRSRANARK